MADLMLAAYLATQPVSALQPTRPAETGAAPQLVVQTGHAQNVLSVVYTPDSRFVVTSSADRTLKLWDLASGSQLRTFIGHVSTVNALAMSPDGESVASGSLDTTIKLWDLATGRELNSFEGHAGSVQSVAFSPNGQFLVSGALDGTMKVWEVRSGREVRTIKSAANAVAISPDGKRILSGSLDKTVKEWDFATGRELRQFAGHSGGVTSVAFSPNQRYLASAGNDLSFDGEGRPNATGQLDQVFKIWDAASGREVHSLTGLTAGVTAIAFSPDGKTLASVGWDKTVRLWNVDSGIQRRALAPQTYWLEAVAFAPDGKTLISGGANADAVVWDAQSGQQLRLLGGTSSSVESVAISPDGQFLAGGAYNGQVKMWDLATGSVPRVLSGHRKRVAAVAFAPNVGMLASASGDGTLKLWNVAGGEELLTLMREPNELEALAFSGDGKLLAVGGAVPMGNTHNQIKLWDMTGKQQPRAFPLQSNIAASVSLSADGILAVGDFEGLINLWNIASGTNRSFPAHRLRTTALSFSPDGKLLASGGFEAAVRLWDVDGNPERVLGETPQDAKVHDVRALAFSRDGGLLASAGEDAAVNLWDVATGVRLQSMRGHTAAVAALAFTADGKAVVSGGEDDTIKLWRVSDGSLLATLTSFRDGSWVVSDALGRFDTSDLEATPYLHWVLPDDPFTALPLELFLRDYYEPRLLSRILNGEKLATVVDIRSLNRVQPQVAITAIAAVADHPEWLDVSVEARGASRRYRRTLWPVQTGAHDLRLFRDGQLVGYSDGKLATAGSTYHHVFRVRLPAGDRPLKFTAYAFNDSRIKSVTAERSFTPTAPVTAEPPRAYVITMGVNRPENPDWNLAYAANDARHFRDILVARLNALKRFEDVVPIALISDEASEPGEADATKARLKAVFDRLAGRQTDVEGIPNADRLRPARPDDLVVVSVSSHGINDGDDFYLVPSDTGHGRGREFTAQLRDHAISSNDLAQWLRDVDAGDMALIIDACQSAASVGEDFKPGPMGARGLGQLAYEKGMRILAASQSQESALESAATQHGLLSYALVNDGLEKGWADNRPKDQKIQLAEWLNFGVQRVPELANEVANGTGLPAGGGRGARLLYKEAPKKVTLQRPALFDFTKGRRDPMLTVVP